LEYYGIANRARLKLTLISELDWKSIILASRKSDFKTLKDHNIISSRVLAVNSFMKSETAIGLKQGGKPVVKRTSKIKISKNPRSRKTIASGSKNFKLADSLISRRSSTSIGSTESKNLSTFDPETLTPMKRFDSSVERAKIVEKSFDRTQEQVQGDTTQNRGIYTFWRALHSDKSIGSIQRSDKQSWSNSRKYVCALSALACQNFTLLKIIHDENLDIFRTERTKSTNRSIVHVASAMGNLQGLKMILYKFNGIYEIMHDKDRKGLTASELAKSVGQKHCGQVLLYYDWQRRNEIKEKNDFNFVDRNRESHGEMVKKVVKQLKGFEQLNV